MHYMVIAHVEHTLRTQKTLISSLLESYGVSTVNIFF